MRSDIIKPEQASLVERVLCGLPVPRTPVWAMRQAGRWDSQFRAVRQGRDFYSFSENAELAAQASLCPLRFGVDAIILFYDITTLSVGMGQEFSLHPGAGPVPARPIRTQADIDQLNYDVSAPAVKAVHETLRIVKQSVPNDIAVLVFAGAPFTLATYMIGTGKNIDATRTFIADQPAVWHNLLAKLSSSTIAFLRDLMADGAVAYQLFDSWAGLLTPSEYQQYALAHHQQIFAETGGHSILFVKDGPPVETRLASGCSALSIGKDDDLADLVKRYPHITFQGNVDHELLITGSADEVSATTRACLSAGRGGRHILNLDHGMDRNAKEENFSVFIGTAKSS